MAVLAAVFLSAGVLRHYWDIYTHRTVRGISFIFVGIDAAGDLFSLTSVCMLSLDFSITNSFSLMILVFQAELNILGMVIYGCELALWTGVFICGGYFNLVPWTKSKLKSRNQCMENERQLQSQGDTTGSISLHQTPSSTSLFRTPSSLLVERSGVGPQ